MKKKIQDLKLYKAFAGSRFARFFSKHPFFGKFCNYEVISYLICGVLTTVVSYVVFALFVNLPTAVANTISFIAAVLFAYVVNKLFVFDSPRWDGKTLVREFLPFLSCRILSYVFETLFLVLTCDILKWPKIPMKIVASVVVVIANYFASKFLVFRKGKDQ